MKESLSSKPINDSSLTTQLTRGMVGFLTVLDQWIKKQSDQAGLSRHTVVIQVEEVKKREAVSFDDL